MDLTNLKRLGVLIALAGLNVALYAGWSAANGHSGYPLDDAWIHQTYARNLAETGQLAYIAGQPSAGSTAPLWTVLISVAYRFGLDPYLWTLALGAIGLALSAWLLARLADQLAPEHRWLGWLAGLACVFEWHLVWAAASGMETMLFIALALALLDRVLAAGQSWSIGLLGGLLTLTRPEGLLLVALSAVAIFVGSKRRRLVQTASLLGAWSAVIAPGLWFNWQASGTFLPNTFYAKQREYASLFASFSIWLNSVAELLLAPFVGGQVLLIPALLTWLAGQRRLLRDPGRWAALLPIAWAALHWLTYAVRLPVAYQHGRYVIPIIPIWLLYGILGTFALVKRLAAPGSGISRFKRMIGLALVAASMIVAIAFVPIGAAAYARDVAVIDGEMVSVARWLNSHTLPDAVIAAHDIGAIGYFTRRRLLDLAGLISPEVIPFIRDESRLLDWLRSQGADYLVTFPSWYPELTRAPIFTTIFAGQSRLSPEHLTVYRAR